MYYMQLKTLKQLLDKNADPELRMMAFKQLAGIQTAVLGMAGVSGLTAVGVATAIMDLFLDDDEENAETIMRKYLGEGLYKGGVNMGTKAIFGGEGVDVSSRVGLSNLLIASNRYNFDPSMEKSIISTLGGPAYGYGSQVVRGVKDMMNGETQRGVENVLPAAIRNMVKSVGRYGDEGALTRRGDPIMGDIGTGLLAAQFLGFAPAEYTLNQERNQVLKGIDRAVNEQRTKLLRKYYISSRLGDDSGFKDNLKEIEAFNKKHPNNRIDQKSIRNSMKKHRESSAKMHYGVLFSPKMKRDLEQLSDEWNDGWQGFGF